MNRANKALPFSLLVLFFPTTAYANMGTPFVLVQAIHLTLGNAILGVIEGCIVGLIFKRSIIRCVGLMILANYFSAWVGKLLLDTVAANPPKLDIYSARRWLWIMALGCYLFTLIAEWPFVALCLRRTRHWLRGSICASLIVQSLSYAGLFAWYWGASEKTLYTQMDIVALSGMSLPEKVLVYYISDFDGGVYVTELSQGIHAKVYGLNSGNLRDSLFAEKSGDPERWDLVARLLHHGDVVLQSGFASLAAPWPDNPTPSSEQHVSLGVGPPVPRLMPAAKSEWAFETGYEPMWPADRLYGENKKTRQKIDVSFATPLATWIIGNAVQLPNDYVVFQLGWDQICVLEANTNRLALVARGRGPVVAIKQASDRSTTLVSPPTQRGKPAG